jgi:prepilin-type N-terminal cleavage/methylation domain-containing protein
VSFRIKGTKNSGFTLIEALLASAIFGMAGFVLALAFNNGQMALFNWEKNTELEKIHDWALERIDIRSLDRDEIEKGGELTSVEGYRIEWEAEAYPTDTLDLFIVDYTINISGGSDLFEEFKDRRLYHHSGWYENDEREKLVEEKEKVFHDMQQAREKR